MDILTRIVKLREERNWSEYKLAEKSGLTQSTISSWYRGNKDTSPKLDSLMRVCEGFGITLSQFFMDDQEKEITLTDSQFALLENISRLTPSQQEALMQFLNSMFSEIQSHETEKMPDEKPDEKPDKNPDGKKADKKAVK